jgi:uncharacterized cupredoxin-like copper-binding protein
MRRVLTLLAISALIVVLVACSGGDTARTINVNMADDMRYDPDRFDVNVGQTVTFEVRNSGQATHEFFIGTADEHRDHAEEMRESNHGDDAHADPAALSLDPGQSGSLTYTFEEAGEMLVGCHEPGHYEAGMVAPVTVHP